MPCWRAWTAVSRLFGSRAKSPETNDLSSGPILKVFALSQELQCESSLGSSHNIVPGVAPSN